MFLYDADCGFCARCAELLTRASARGSYDVLAWQSVDVDAVGLSPQACQEASWFVAKDGTLHRGADGIARALREGAVPLRPVGVLMSLPGVRVLSRAVYGWVARNRHRMLGATDQCRTPQPAGSNSAGRSGRSAMAEFVIRASSPLPASACFDRLVDWDAHSAAIPVTRLRHDGEPRVGQRFVARTGLGRFGFDDVMLVELLRRPAGDAAGALPGLVEIAKHGRVVGGRVRWTVTPTTVGSEVEWRQNLQIGWLPRWLGPVVGLVGRAAYTAGLKALLSPAQR